MLLITRFMYVLLFFFSCLLPAGLFPQENRMDESHVREVMERLLEYHVDHEVVSSTVFERSLKVFLKNFDSERVYFLHKEVESFLSPSMSDLDQMTRDYYQDEILSSYRRLDAVIKSGVMRARKFRGELYERYEGSLIEEALSSEKLKEEKKDHWAKSERELEKRQKKQLISFIQSQEKSLESREEEGIEEKIVELYEKRVRAIEDDYLYYDVNGKALTQEEKESLLVVRVLKALAKSLDSHTSFFSNQEAYDMRVQLEKGFQGIGVILQEGVDGITITRLIDGGPAQKSGLVRIDDAIVEVDGESIVHYPFKKVLELIRGKGGSSVQLGLLRKGSAGETSEVVQVSLKRGRVVLDEKRVDVSHEEHEDGIIGKITLYSFYEGNDVSSERDIRNAIRDLESKGELKGLVLDLRENLGGFLMQAVKVAGLFITNGVVVVAKYSDGDSKYFRDVDGHAYFDGPLVVLTSKASASAAEIVAQTLQDYGAAIIVGDEHTYGKGSIQHQTITNESSRAFFKVTVGRYYTVSGKSTQIDGVQADIVVPTRYSKREIGEKLLDYPLPGGSIDEHYYDLLSDLDWDSRRWYMKYYLPSLQKKETFWISQLPALKENSEERIQSSEEFTLLFDEGQEEKASSKDQKRKDIQMNEAVNILKDMIFLYPSDEEQEQYALEGVSEANK